MKHLSAKLPAYQARSSRQASNRGVASSTIHFKVYHGISWSIMVYHQPSGFWWFYFQVELLNPPHFTAPAPSAPAKSDPTALAQRSQVTPEEFRKRTPKELLSALAWLHPGGLGLLGAKRNRGIPCPGGWNITWMSDDIDKAECKWCMKITPNWWISNYSR